MWRLWEVLRSRVYATRANLEARHFTFEICCWILDPHDYYGAFWCKAAFWEEYDWRSHYMAQPIYPKV